MTKLLRPLAYFGLALTFIPCLLFYAGSLGQGTMKLLMLLGSLVWLAAFGWYSNISAKEGV